MLAGLFLPVVSVGDIKTKEGKRECCSTTYDQDDTDGRQRVG